MQEAFYEIKKSVEQFHKLKEEDWNLFASVWKRNSARRRQLLTAAGDTEHYLYFILEGVQRIYFVDEQGREFNIIFTYAPSFGGVLDSFLLQKPSRYYYETISATVFLQAHATAVKKLMEQNIAIANFINEALGMTLSGLLERITDLQCLSSEEKFRKLLQRSPHILQIVPQKHLAAYLGIDVTNFSKFINNVRI